MLEPPFRKTRNSISSKKSNTCFEPTLLSPNVTVPMEVDTERCLIIASPHSTNLAFGIATDELLNMFDNKAIEIVDQYMAHLLCESSDIGRIKNHKKLINLGDKTLAVKIKNQVDQLKVNKGGKA
uniref:DUF674 family protein n=1 Tax=Rhabditophanes sp. KR3021 TaxID=114890 RepID=A0AC35TMD4_9BILA